MGLALPMWTWCRPAPDIPTSRRHTTRPATSIISRVAGREDGSVKLTSSEPELGLGASSSSDSAGAAGVWNVMPPPPSQSCIGEPNLMQSLFDTPELLGTSSSVFSAKYQRVPELRPLTWSVSVEPAVLGTMVSVMMVADA